MYVAYRIIISSIFDCDDVNVSRQTNNLNRFLKTKVNLT